MSITMMTTWQQYQYQSCQGHAVVIPPTRTKSSSCCGAAAPMRKGFPSLDDPGTTTDILPMGRNTSLPSHGCLGHNNNHCVPFIIAVAIARRRTAILLLLLY